MTTQLWIWEALPDPYFYTSFFSILKNDDQRILTQI